MLAGLKSSSSTRVPVWALASLVLMVPCLPEDLWTQKPTPTSTTKATPTPTPTPTPTVTPPSTSTADQTPSQKPITQTTSKTLTPNQNIAATSERGRALLARYCFSCHGDQDKIEADLDLKRAPFLLDIGQHLEVLQSLHDQVSSGQMPPRKADQPSATERAELLAFIESERRSKVRQMPKDPGRVTIRRLSRVEYAHVVRDLFGIGETDNDQDLTKGFPADDLGYGFDNIGDALSFSLLHLETYTAAAERIATRILVTPPETNPRTGFGPDAFQSRRPARTGPEGSRALYDRGRVAVDFVATEPGTYRLHLHAYGQQVGEEPTRVRIDVDQTVVADRDVTGTQRNPQMRAQDVVLSEGAHSLGFNFINDLYQPDHKDPSQRDRNLYLLALEVEGPLEPQQVPERARWLMANDPGQGETETRARLVLRELLHRTFRRPAEPEEVRALTDLVTAGMRAGDTFVQALQTAVVATLVSPHFLYRFEMALPPDASLPPSTERLSDHAVAARLSFFLWSSVPDQELRQRADRGGLTGPTRAGQHPVVAEALRMLNDDRAHALATNFAAQWLELRALAEVAPDPARFPFDDTLRQDMRKETELFVQAVLKENRPVQELLDADHSFLNARLAAHYGLAEREGWSAPTSLELKRVTLPDGRRGGLLTHGSVLTLTSNATRTSPVKRGKWILENLLDQAPPPPPPGADSLQEEEQIVDARSLRQQLASHRSRADCASCHVRMDALGFALEHFDAVGRERRAEGGEPIDASGLLPDGRRIEGVSDLSLTVRNDPAFVRCLTRKLFTYAIGRAPTAADDAALSILIEDLPPAPTFTDLVKALVVMDAFLLRRVH